MIQKKQKAYRDGKIGSMEIRLMIGFEPGVTRQDVPRRTWRDQVNIRIPSHKSSPPYCFLP